ncbi:MAG: hypothetical protein SFU85_08540 [Candidatus Methylacidiphilales bacterium]|nr:hypothetical protein [Candidatus Methylacidiphilales bacterium]
MKNLFKSLLAAALIGATSAQAAEVSIGKFIETNTTWVAATTYVLTEITYVTSGSTLTIQPGTTVIGRGPTFGNPATLIVARGAQLVANGNATSPIIFTSDDDDRVPNGSASNNSTNTDTLVDLDNRCAQWGGIVLLGRTHVSRNGAGTDLLDNDGSDSNIIEGVANDNVPTGRTDFVARAGYGGQTTALARDDDNSGSLQYVSIRYGGVGLTTNSEVNGLTLGAVGRSTTLQNIEIVNNLDDGIEFFGGTVNTKYIAMYGIGDDCFDWDEGFRGKNQFIFAVQTQCKAGGTVGSGVPDKGGELDGSNSNSDEAWPYSLPTVYNATFVGMGKNYSGAGGAAPRNTAFHFRDASGGRVRNSLFLDFYYGLAIEDEKGTLDSTGVNAPGAGERDSAAKITTNFNPSVFGGNATVPDDGLGGKELEFRECIWWAADGSNGVNSASSEFAPDSSTEGAAAYDGGGSRPSYGDLAYTNGVNLSRVNGNGTSPIVSLVRRQYGTTSTADSATTYQISQIDPRASGNATSSSITAPVDGFYSPVSYKGAFSPSKNWLRGWSLMDSVGLFPAGSNPSNQTASSPAFLFSFDFATVNGVTYEIGASTSPAGPFSPIGSVVGDGSTTTYVDTRTVTTRQFYSVTAQ